MTPEEKDELFERMPSLRILDRVTSDKNSTRKEIDDAMSAVGHDLILSVDFVGIGQQKIDTQYGEWMSLQNELEQGAQKAKEKKTYEKLPMKRDWRLKSKRK
jgi:hypothetical protein